MKIGIAKLGISVRDLISNKHEDHNGRFKELNYLIEIFKNFGHEVFFIDRFNMPFFELDKIFVLNGIIDDHSMTDILRYRNKTKCLYYILTDLRLINNEISYLFDILYTQSITNIPYILNKQKYNGMPELACYKADKNKEYDKDNLFIFGGGIRNRGKDFIEYLNNKEFKLFIKTSYSDSRVSINVYHEELSRSKYSLIINDNEYNECGFVTWRYFENIRHDVVTFLDHKVDKDNIIELNSSVRDFLTVSNYKEMIERINDLESDQSLKNLIVQTQKLIINDDIISGKYTYDKLMKGD